MADNGLIQVVTEHIFHQNTFDLFFTNNPTYVYNTKVIPGICVDGHIAIFVECDILPIRNKQVPSSIKDSFRASHSAYDLMTELESTINKFVPQKIARTKDKVPWITNKLKKQLRKRKKLFEKQRGSNMFSRAS